MPASTFRIASAAAGAVVRFDGFVDLQEAARTAGAQRVIAKPLEFPKLLVLVEEALGQPNC